MKLANIEKVDLREVWKHEALDFTQWLAEKENLELLGEEVGIDISLIQTEASVGKFNVDILAQENNTGRKIIIENQLEVTDHDHLGKIITYASGHDAEVIIWIVKTVREEHKQAVDWLNEHTDDKIYFFVIEMELWKIADSPCAPKFNIVCKPNDWAKAIKNTSSKPGELSEVKLCQFDFWTKFKEYAKSNNDKLKLRKPYPQHWYDISFGFSMAYITLTTNSQSKQVGCELYIPDSKPTYHFLLENKQGIESALEEELIWDELPQKKASRIKLYVDGDISDQSTWEQIHQWLLSKTMQFQEVFGKYLKKVNNS